MWAFGCGRVRDSNRLCVSNDGNMCALRSMVESCDLQRSMHLDTRWLLGWSNPSTVHAGHFLISLPPAPRPLNLHHLHPHNDPPTLFPRMPEPLFPRNVIILPGRAFHAMRLRSCARAAVLGLAPLTSGYEQVCMKSGVAFGLTQSRHHCTSCGRVFALEYCNRRVPLPHHGFEQVTRTVNTAVVAGKWPGTVL